MISAKSTYGSRSDTIAKWYKEAFPLVAAYIQKRGGGLEEAKEIFQQAVCIYYEKLQFGDFKPQKTDQAYLVGIAKNTWLKHCDGQKYHEDISTLEATEEAEQELHTAKLFMQIRQAGEKCLDLLQAFYFEKLNMSQVAQRFGYSSKRSATVQKFKCLEKVRNEVKRKSMRYADFLK
jgi:RNA polymerase sigma factor (sigma-70 family)